MRFYVYQYLREDGIPYYIGKGSGKRMNVKHSIMTEPGHQPTGFVPGRKLHG
jgi:hypothetical protein